MVLDAGIVLIQTNTVCRTNIFVLPNLIMHGVVKQSVPAALLPKHTPASSRWRRTALFYVTRIKPRESPVDVSKQLGTAVKLGRYSDIQIFELPGSITHKRKRVRK